MYTVHCTEGPFHADYPRGHKVKGVLVVLYTIATPIAVLKYCTKNHALRFSLRVGN